MFEFTTLKKLIEEAPEPLKAYFLLMANCGMTAMDVGDLLNSEVNTRDGTISRVRSKRQKRRMGQGDSGNNEVKVKWKLWPITVELLLKHRDTTSERVFTNSAGSPIVYTKINPETHKGCDVDLIDKAYRKYMGANNCKKKKKVLPLKCIRATSATKIGEHTEYARFAQHFLGQSPRSISEKFYVKPSQEQFDRCLHWLGQEYGFIA